MTRLAVSIVAHDDHTFLAHALRSVSSVEDRFVFVSRLPWSSEAGEYGRVIQVAREEGATLIEGDWPSEFAHRTAAYGHLRAEGFTHALVMDCDEIIEPRLLEHLVRVARAELADRVYVEWDTYWKDTYHVIRPRERFTPCYLIDLRVAQYMGVREFAGGRSLLLNDTYGIVHHLSYAGGDERIHRKVTTWGHKDEVVPCWWDHVWRHWDQHKTLHNLHPTHPSSYGFAEHITLPECLSAVGLKVEEHEPLEKQGAWPTVTVVIPVHGGSEDLLRCLESLAKFPSLIHQVIVVDNASEDGAIEQAGQVLKTLPNSQVMSLPFNQGFAAACNAGFHCATGDIVLFLNSDTVVPKAGYIRLIESLWSSGTIAAVGPYSNNVGHLQRTDVTYTSWETLDLFAQDFANRSHEDRDVDMLVGFCLAVRRSAIFEVGGFDESFGLGTFEDNDLCYRLRRAGYRLVISSRSFVHHTGSKTLVRVVEDTEALLRQNLAKFELKWRDDLALGFSDGLSGLSSKRITFNLSRKPETFWKSVSELKERARISLCMIVKNEERVLADCLRSAKPYFAEIVVVDTGSTDQTPAIAESFGCKVVHSPWKDSFSEARNVSLSHASCDWVFWLDADDTLPLQTGHTLLSAASSAPEEVMAFIVPVRFVDEGPNSGVQVDHVKLFRRFPGIEFEGRIHEQIVGPLRKAKPEGQIVRLGANVLHSGYDTSEEGQAKKRERDERLLKLDLEDRPGHPFVLFNLGMTAHYTGDHEGAIGWLKQCLGTSSAEESHVRKAYAMLGGSFRKIDCVEEAISTFCDGLEAIGPDPEIHFFLGQIHSERGNYDEARSHYEACLAVDTSSFFSSIDQGILGFKTMHNLAAVEAAAERYPEARKWFLAAIENAPEFMPSAFSLFDLARQEGDRETAIQMLEFVRSREGESQNWKTMKSKLAG